MLAVSVADAKTFLNITTTAQDAEVERMVERAEAVIARRIGPLRPTVVTGEVHTGPGPLTLRRGPVMDVISVTTGQNAAVTSGFDLDVETGTLHGWFSPIHRGIRVTYRIGWVPLPTDLEAAVLELTKHLWESQRITNPGGRPGFSEMDPNPEVGPTARYLLPYRVQTLLEPFLPPVVA